MISKHLIVPYSIEYYNIPVASIQIYSHPSITILFYEDVWSHTHHARYTLHIYQWSLGNRYKNNNKHHNIPVHVLKNVELRWWMTMGERNEKMRFFYWKIFVEETQQTTSILFCNKKRANIKNKPDTTNMNNNNEKRTEYHFEDSVYMDVPKFMCCAPINKEHNSSLQPRDRKWMENEKRLFKNP